MVAASPGGEDTTERTLKAMQWTRSDTIGLAKPACAHCHGYGLRTGLRGKESPCHCVFRAIFRACYARFRECTERARHMSHVNLEICARGKDRRFTFSRKTEDYLADFCLVSRRALDDFDYRLFRFHFLLGADWKLCCRRMNIDRGTFFHSVYRIENILGRTFRELEPYALYPLDEYFGSQRQMARPPLAAGVNVKRMPVRPSLSREFPALKSA